VIAPVIDSGTLRTFATGATRDTSKTKLEPFGFLSPVALHRFSEYMHKHRLQSDGNLRDSDNWKKGMPEKEYIQSLIRHVMDFWLVTSGEAPRYDTKVSDPEEIACAILFNIQGYLHERGTGRWPTQLVVRPPFGHAYGPVQAHGLNYVNVDEDLSREVDEAFDRITDGAASR